jgi:hypothetical protein
MIKSKSKAKMATIDLTGPEGNAFVLLGKARTFAKQLGLDPKAITEEMMKGDYENLVSVFDKHFGNHVILYR